MIEKAERFAPGAGRKHRAHADAAYTASLAAADTDGPEGGHFEPSSGPEPPDEEHE
jgi:hypothetical protein